jgi:hypothetical protein
MTRYSKIITSVTNIGIPIFTYYVLPETKIAFNQCENLWSTALGSSFITLLLLFDSLPKICNDKKIIWTSYCCIPIPYTIIAYFGAIAYSIFQICKIISLNEFCKNYYIQNYHNLWLLTILQISNYGLNFLLIY